MRYFSHQDHRFLRSLTTLLLFPLLLALACGEYPSQEGDEVYGEYLEDGVAEDQFSSGTSEGSLPTASLPDPPGQQPLSLPLEPRESLPETEIQRPELPRPPDGEPEVVDLGAPVQTQGEGEARELLVSMALRIYETLEAGSTYPVRSGAGTRNLLVRYPKGTHTVKTASGTFMCTDFVLYTFTQAGFDLSEAGLGSRSTRTMTKKFREHANGENVTYTSQGGNTPPRPGDIAFMQGHVAIITAIDGTKVTYTQFNSRNQYRGKLTRTGDGYHLEVNYGIPINGWGFYYPL